MATSTIFSCWLHSCLNLCRLGIPNVGRTAISKTGVVADAPQRPDAAAGNQARARRASFRFQLGLWFRFSVKNTCPGRSACVLVLFTATSERRDRSRPQARQEVAGHMCKATRASVHIIAYAEFIGHNPAVLRGRHWREGAHHATWVAAQLVASGHAHHTHFKTRGARTTTYVIPCVACETLLGQQRQSAQVARESRRSNTPV